MNKILVSLMLIGLTGGAAFALPSAEAMKSTCQGIWVKGLCVPYNPCTSGEKWRAFCAKVFADIEIGDSSVARALARMVIKQEYPNVPDSQIEENASGTAVDHALGQDYIAYNIGDTYLQFEFGDTHDYTNTDNIKNVVMAVCRYMQADMTEFTHEKGNYTLATCDVAANSKTCKEIMSALKTVDPQHFTDRLKKTDNEKCTFVQEYL